MPVSNVHKITRLSDILAITWPFIEEEKIVTNSFEEEIFNLSKPVFTEPKTDIDKKLIRNYAKRSRYRKANKIFFDLMPSIKEKYVIFTTPKIPDRTDPKNSSRGKRLEDMLGFHNSFIDGISEIMNEISANYFDDFVIVAMAPLLNVVKPLGMHRYFLEQWELINRELEISQQNLGSTHYNNSFLQSSYAINSALFEKRHAKMRIEEEGKKEWLARKHLSLRALEIMYEKTFSQISDKIFIPLSPKSSSSDPFSPSIAKVMANLQNNEVIYPGGGKIFTNPKKLPRSGIAERSALTKVFGVINAIEQGSESISRKIETVNEEFRFRQCHYNHSISCHVQDKCDRIFGYDKCPQYVFENLLSEEEKNLILEDSKENGFMMLPGIEAIEILVRQGHFDVMGDSRSSSEIRNLISSMKPLVLPYDKVVSVPNVRDARMSGLGSKCAVEKLIGLSKDNLETLANENSWDIPVWDVSLKGTAQHKFTLDPLIEDGVIVETLINKEGMNPSRTHCEQAVVFEYKGKNITGHIDALYHDEKTDTVIIIDKKRMRDMPHLTIKQKLQLTGYAHAVYQMLDLPFKRAILGRLARVENLNPKGEFTTERLRFYYIEGKQDSFLKELDKTLIEQSNLIKGRISVAEYKKNYEFSHCTTCLAETKAYCDKIFENNISLEKLIK